MELRMGRTGRLTCPGPTQNGAVECDPEQPLTPELSQLGHRVLRVRESFYVPYNET